MKIKLPSMEILVSFSVCLITLIGLFLRLYNLDQIPIGFFADEAATGLHAYSILHTGKDYNGVSFPLFFQSFGYFLNPIEIYLTVPFIKIFGLTEFSTRLPSSLIGTIMIPFSAFLVLLMNPFNKKKWNLLFSICTALFFAISPWHIHFSRFPSQVIFFPSFLVIALTVFLYGISRKKKLMILISSFLFGLTLYTYYPAWLLVPLIFAIIYILYSKELFQLKIAIFFGLIFIIMSLPLANSVVNGEVLTRWKDVRTINNQDSIQALSNLINPYYAHFTPDFLFLKGDINYPGHFITRFSSKGAAQMYLFQLPFLITGLLFLVKNFKKRYSVIIFTLLLLYPIGGTLANSDGGGAIAWRSILGVIPLNVIASIGITVILDIINRLKSSLIKIPIYGIIIFTIFFSTLYYAFEYHYKYVAYSSDFWGWQYGPREIMKYFVSQKNNYGELFMSGEFNSGEIFLRFYDPENTCQSKCMIGDIWNTPNIFNPLKKQLFSLSPGYLEKSIFKDRLNIKLTLYYPNGKVAFLIGEIIK